MCLDSLLPKQILEDPTEHILLKEFIMKEDFKKFKTAKEMPAKEMLKENPDVKLILKKFVAKKSELSDLGLVSLVVMANTGLLTNESCKEELEVFDFIKDGKVTSVGEQYINEDKSIDRLKKLIED
jgi:hypothetical protein